MGEGGLRGCRDPTHSPPTCTPRVLLQGPYVQARSSASSQKPQAVPCHPQPRLPALAVPDPLLVLIRHPLVTSQEVTCEWGRLGPFPYHPMVGYTKSQGVPLLGGAWDPNIWGIPPVSSTDPQALEQACIAHHLLSKGSPSGWHQCDQACLPSCSLAPVAARGQTTRNDRQANSRPRVPARPGPSCFCLFFLAQGLNPEATHARQVLYY